MYRKCILSPAAIDQEIIFTAIIPLPLIQEGQLSVTGESSRDSQTKSSWLILITCKLVDAVLSNYYRYCTLLLLK